ncbi:hypothetical protein SOVF_159850 isoform B [Spinacia oleracea]|uniref:LEAF RUST 10 DISEASE-RESISTANCEUS RECEPTOR-LIKE PROTEIN KINASE-like 1.1 isoform X2 n=1 Tax=Spinacia oleracea TaxID=3562 RepID=A0A9R0J6D5_SPIOL|nr:LEAF RUST 10 DISEASE-RESISTANCE LOCUS RECEPTOR-LIKE PROTEIN KINASE-like 1.1 isoform X2 [Spinacia oleracea]KNA08752.1 hypothetical protein SOVF_159850 isoform B [Spinacia oleracea]
MASASVGLIFLVCNFVVLHLSAEEEKEHVCPSTFQCGEFGPWYRIKNTFSNNKSFLLSDYSLQYVATSNRCHVFQGSTFHLPKSTSLIFTNLHNITLWKCHKTFNRNHSVPRILACPNFSIYHSNHSDDVTSFLSCKPFQYPLFLMLELSDKCSRCVTGGGRCQDLKNHKFHCINKRKERRKLRLLLGLGISGGIIVVTVLGLLFWCLKKVKLRSLGMGSGNIGKQTMRMKTNIEGSKVYFSVPVFSYSELEEATNNFDPTRELGDGGFGTVYYGKLVDGREVAVKRLYERNCRQLELYMNEIEILACLRHQNLVTLYGCTSRRSRELLLVYEYVSNGTVADHLNGEQSICGTLTWPVRMRIAIETATALSYLHASDVIHRDVKTQNILLDTNFSVKVADFGLSRLFPMDVTHISTAPQGTPGYLDPEYHQCYQLTDKSDVYSFGVVLVELISSLPAVDLTRKEDEINLSYYAMKRIQCCAFDELVDKRLGFDSNYKVKRMTTLVAELAFQCLQHRKDFRPSMDEVLETLKRIESADYEVRKAAEEKEENDVWLFRNMENLQSPNSAMYKWGSSNSITPTASR